MARPLRIQYPGACYHVMNRGNRGEDIFITDTDRSMDIRVKARIVNNVYKILALIHNSSLGSELET